MTYENKTLPTIQTLADVATDEDKLFRDGFVKGVSSFIKTCPTPMTIAIQGDWGTGKTSFINLIEAELQAQERPSDDNASHAKKYCEDIINVVTIDAWQQSIVNPRIGLFGVVLGEMASKLSGSSLSEVKSFSEFATTTAQIVSTFAGINDQGKDDSSFDSIFGLLFDSDDNAKAPSEDEFVSSEDVSSFYTACVDALQKSAEENDKSDDSRFVVFVDGLDYINPEDAIDLMEQTKTYLECPRCVFVLAVDERTVFDGARKKLGDKVDEGRKKMLFDRYIQVPLRIPADAYNLDKYIENLLKDRKELSGKFAKVANTLFNGPTPRRVKRCINTMYLYRNVLDGMEEAGDDSLSMLFAAVILKAESVQGFDAVASCTEGDGAHFTEALRAALEPLGVIDGIDWTALPSLWSGAEGGDDAAKRDAFISWIRLLK